MADNVVHLVGGRSRPTELSLSPAERFLIEVLREGNESLNISIAFDGTQWTVLVDCPHDGHGPGHGSGRTFDEAWMSNNPWWAAGGNDDGGRNG